MMKIEGNFSKVFNAMQIEDTVFMVGTDSIYKLNLHTGQLSYHRVQAEVQRCANDNYNGMIAIVAGK